MGNQWMKFVKQQTCIGAIVLLVKITIVKGPQLLKKITVFSIYQLDIIIMI